MKWSITSVERFSNLVRKTPSANSRNRSYLLGIGLHSLAVKHYERVLEIVEKKTKTNPDVRGFISK
jgi:hypothetical protein